MSDTERDYKNIWDIEILVLDEIECRKMRKRKLSKVTPVSSLVNLVEGNPLKK